MSRSMKIIELDGSAWSDGLDYFRALHVALGAIPAHSLGFDAFEDSVFCGGMLAVEPPFQIVVRNCPAAAAADVELMANGWAKQRAWKKANHGEDVEASIRLER